VREVFKIKGIEEGKCRNMAIGYRKIRKVERRNGGKGEEFKRQIPLKFQ
jgi:hypothetical protein